MGLSGRKVKQRIGADPRNLTWADDASKFGATYLAKFGWTSSQGLGAEGEGRTSHIKVSQKLDMLGIGAAQSKDPNGIAWKQNKDFESLLKRLNADNETSQTPNSENESESEKEAEQKEEKKEKKKRKREEEGDKERKKKRKKLEAGEDAKGEAPSPAATAKESSAPVVPRHRAHRARHIAAKSFASKSALAISEILGIASTPSSSQITTVATPTGTLTPIDSEAPLEKLTTSTKSVSDYFKERLLAKSSGRSTPAQAVLTSDANEPRGGLGSSRINNVDSEDDQDESPRGGLGASRALATNSGLATSQITTSKFASMFASFRPATTSTTQDPEPAVSNIQVKEDVEVVETKKRKEEKKKAKRRKEDLELESQDTTDEDERAEKKRRKEERRKAKEAKAATVAVVDEDREKEEKKRKKKEKKEKRKEAEPES
ncbi:hypothetical protein AAF712_000486 [Marasmius tenuissimus]|uniref:PinX1-related protein 1 n=1 Tax=Marasmius tenuissimus TaxID=585030 RepID=A0ABR3AI90_9AGAR|nr:hypothetical protein PM082_001317 [Marasmius tenuissimus]